MEILKHIRFFRRHPIFAVTTPQPFTYGISATIDARANTVTWWDAREHMITVKLVGMNDEAKLTIVDSSDRKFVFEPMTLAFWNTRFDERFPTIEKLFSYIRDESRGW